MTGDQRRQGGPRQGGPRRPNEPGRRPKSGAQKSGRTAPQRPRRAAPASAAPVDVHVADGVRLQKVLAQAGLGSRRACERLIATGRVTVDGNVVTELGVRVDPSTAVIHVDGLRVQLDSSIVTLAVNKPRGVVSTMNDPEGRPTVGDLVANRSERLFHVGRLDADTEGLILLTNDGELAHRLAHPSYEIPKTYLATVEGSLPRGVARQVQEAGVTLADGHVAVDEFRIIDTLPKQSLVEIVLHEGRNHVVRRLLAEVGFPVSNLVRTRIGPIVLGDLRPGTYRVVGGNELGRLMQVVGL